MKKKEVTAVYDTVAYALENELWANQPILKRFVDDLERRLVEVDPAFKATYLKVSQEKIGTMLGG